MSDTRTAIRLIIWVEGGGGRGGGAGEGGRTVSELTTESEKLCPRNWLSSVQLGSAQSAEAWERGGTLNTLLLLSLVCGGRGNKKIVVKFVKCEKRKLLRNI